MSTKAQDYSEIITHTELIDPDGEWLLELGKIMVDACIAFAIWVFLPYLSVLFWTTGILRTMPHQRAKVLAIPFAVWTGILLGSYFPIVLLVPTFFEVTRIVRSIINVVGKNL